MACLMILWRGTPVSKASSSICITSDMGIFTDLMIVGSNPFGMITSYLFKGNTTVGILDSTQNENQISKYLTFKSNFILLDQADFVRISKTRLQLLAIKIHYLFPQFFD